MKPWMAVVTLTWVIKGYGCNKAGHGDKCVIEYCHFCSIMHYILKFRFIVSRDKNERGREPFYCDWLIKR